MPDFGIKKKGYRPRWQDTPGFKTVVDDKSTKGILPEQLESTNPDRGQGNMDAMWPVAPGTAREKERALPLPSNHDKKREKRIGPTYFNKPRKSPQRTLDQPGEQYGHPTKFDYHFPRRRHFPRPPPGTLAMMDDGIDEEEPVDDVYEEDPIDDQLEVEGAGTTNKGPFPTERQKNQAGLAKMRSRMWYRRNRQPKKRRERRDYKKERRRPKQKLKRRYRRQFPHRFKRKGIDPRTPAQKTKDWREEQKRRRIPGTSDRDGERRAGIDLLGEVMEIMGFETEAASWPVNWNTHLKKTQPPGKLDQNFGPGRSRDTGTPRTDPTRQRGDSLRAPGLDTEPQVGLKWKIEPAAPGSSDYRDIARPKPNPTDGSGKVIPMSYYTDIVNNTQAIPDGRQDRYLRNNNFDVKVATGRIIRELCRPSLGPSSRRVAKTVGEILDRCDSKIKQRSKKYAPRLARIDTKNWIWHWDVGDHTVRVQAFKRGNATNFPKLNLKVSCSCPFWRWWGPAHWATRDDYQKGRPPGTAEYPEVRDPARWRPVCKHAYAVLQKSRDFFVRPEKSPLKKLGARFSVDNPGQVEVRLLKAEGRCDKERTAARVARRHLEAQMGRRVTRRYVEGEES